jgi:Outer membrane protein beta-barrel domain
MRYALALLLGVALAPLPIAAQPLTGGFVGLGIGSFDHKESDGAGNTILSGSTTKWQGLGGYEFNDHFAVEGSWGKTGSITGTFTQSFPGSGPLTVNLIEKYETYTLRAVGMLPLKSVKLVGGAGYYNSRLTATLRIEGVPGELSDNSTVDNGAMLLGGVQVDLERFSIRAEYEWFDTPRDVESSEVTVNVLFKF